MAHIVPHRSVQHHGISQLSIPFVCINGGSTWTNMPLAQTFYNASHAHATLLDLTDYRQARLSCGVNSAGVSGATLTLLFKSSFSTTVGDYANIGTTAVAVSLTTGATVNVSSWIDLAAGANADVYLIISGAGGDGAVDPAIFNLVAEFR